jgi:phosphate transport system substrate-binding protein
MRKTPGAIGAARLKAYQIGESRVAFAVHPTNTIRALTRGQLSDVFTGKVRNWRELGGADQEIVIVAGQSGDGLRTGVEAELLKGEDLPSGTRAMTSATQIARVVSQLPGGIGIVAPLSLDESVAELRAGEPIVRPLILVTLGDEPPEVRRVLEAVAAIGGKS